MDKKTIRGLQILREELHLEAVKKDFAGRLESYFPEEAVRLRDETDSSYLSKKDLEIISRRSVDRYVQDILDRKF